MTMIRRLLATAILCAAISSAYAGQVTPTVQNTPGQTIYVPASRPMGASQVFDDSGNVLGTAANPLVTTGGGGGSTANQGTANTAANAWPVTLVIGGALNAVGNPIFVAPGTASTWAATQSGNWSVRLQDGSGTAITSDARGSERPLSVQVLDASGNQVTAFGGTGGTASNFGSAFPTPGTAAGFNDAAGHMDYALVDASHYLDVDVQASALPTGAATSANQPTNAALGSTTSGQTGTLGLATVNGSPPSTIYTAGQSEPLNIGVHGSLRTEQPDWVGAAASYTINTTSTCTPPTAAAGCIYIPVNDGMATLVFTATYSGGSATISLAGTVDGTNYFPINWVTTTGGTIASTFSASNSGRIRLAGLKTVAMYVSGGTSANTVGVAWEQSAAGSLTVLGEPLPNGGNTIGALTANQSVNVAEWNGAANSTSNPVYTTSLATASATAGVTPVVSAALESSHVFKGSAGNLYSVVVTTGASAGFLMIFDATSAPSNGAVTPKQCVRAPANSTVALSFNGPPETYAAGITAVFSTGANCFTKTASATAFFNGHVQ
jgi:hypothetical protein